MSTYNIVLKEDELYHYGILGQKWGLRRYQNPDGTLTEEGRRRYAKETSEAVKEGRSPSMPNPKKWVEKDIENDKALAKGAIMSVGVLALKAKGAAAVGSVVSTLAGVPLPITLAALVGAGYVGKKAFNAANKAIDKSVERLAGIDMDDLGPLGEEVHIKHSIFDDELEHYGIPDMRWGLRRYQNPDGTLTPEGIIRYRKERNKMLSSSKNPSDPDEIDKARRQALSKVDDWGREDLTNRNELAGKAKSAMDSVGTLYNAATAGSTRNLQRNRKMNLSDYTDKELQDMMNRYNLETRFNEMFN